MEIVAKTTVRIAPRKIRLVADSIRKLSLEQALVALSVFSKRGAGPLEKTLKSAVANAINNNNVKKENLKIKSIDVLEAPSYKRFHPSTRGRIHPYKRRGSNIKIVLTDDKFQISNLKSQISSKKSNQQKSIEEKEEENGTKS